MSNQCPITVDPKVFDICQNSINRCRTYITRSNSYNRIWDVCDCTYFVFLHYGSFKGTPRWIDGSPYSIAFWDWSWPHMTDIELGTIQTLLLEITGVNMHDMEGDCTGAVISVHFWNVMHWVKVPCHHAIFPAFYHNCEYKKESSRMAKNRRELSSYFNPYYSDSHLRKIYWTFYFRIKNYVLPPYTYYAKNGTMLYIDVRNIHCPMSWLLITFMFQHRCIFIVHGNQTTYGDYDGGGSVIQRLNHAHIAHLPIQYDMLRHDLFFANQALLRNISSLYIPGTSCSYYTKSWFDDTHWDFHYDTNCTMSSVIDHKLIMTSPVYATHKCLGGHFKCDDGTCILVEYECDGIPQCTDGSDEDNCDAVCDLPKSSGCVNCHSTTCKCTDFFYQCETSGCIPLSKLCDRVSDCNDESDEIHCFYDYVLSSAVNNRYGQRLGEHSSEIHTGFPKSSPVYVHKSRYFLCVNDGMCDPDISPCSHLRFCYVHECPGYFKCFLTYCVPYWRICDGKNDCPYGDDEAACDSFLCRGMFKCIYDGICVSMHDVCDGIVNCPKSWEDEMLCEVFELDNPNCHHRGDALVCKKARLNQIPIFPSAKALLISKNAGMDISVFEFQKMILLVILKFVECSITSFPSNIFHKPNQLLELDLSHNMLTTISKDDLRGLHKLRKLNLAYNKIRNLHWHTLSFLHNLRELHIEQNQMNVYDHRDFVNLLNLDYIESNERIICCFTSHNSTCKVLGNGPFDDVYDCNRLLASPYSRAVIWFFSFAVVFLNITCLGGNFGLWLKTKRKLLIPCMYLNISDLAMGVYMLMIGITDFLYQGEYAIIDSWWRQSWQCKVVGFLALFSMEASTVAILCVTMMRFSLAFHYKYKQYKKYKHAIYRNTLALIFISVAFSIGKALIMHTTSPLCLFFMSDSDTPLYIVGIIYTSIAFNTMIFSAVILLLTWVKWMTHESTKIPETFWKNSGRYFLTRVIFLSTVNFTPWLMLGIITVLNIRGHQIARQVIMWSLWAVPFNAILHPLIYSFSSLAIRRTLMCRNSASLAAGAVEST